MQPLPAAGARSATSSRVLDRFAAVAPLFALALAATQLAVFEHVYGQGLWLLRTTGDTWRVWGLLGVVPKNIALLAFGAALVLVRPSAVRFVLAQGFAARDWRAWAFVHVAAASAIAGVAHALSGTSPPGQWPEGIPWLLVIAVPAWIATAALLVAPPPHWLDALRTRWRQLAFVLAAAAAYKFSVHLQPVIEQVASDLLFQPTTSIARALDGWAGFDTAVDPVARTLRVGGFSEEIAPSCLGYAGIGLVFLFLVAHLYAWRRELRFPIVLVVVPAAMAAIWLLNGVRIAVLMAIGASGWPDVAVHGFHSAAGWVTLMAVTLACAVALDRMPLFSSRPARERATLDDDDAQLVPQLVLLGAGLVTLMFSSTFDWLYPVRIAAAGGLLVAWRARWRLGRLDLNPGPAAIGAAVFVAWIALIPADPARSQELARSLSTAPLWLGTAWVAARWAGSVIVVPLAEELAFRGFLLQRIADALAGIPAPLRIAAAVAASSAAFGALHGSWFAGTLAGVAFAGARYLRGRVIDAVTAHAVANLLIGGYVLAGGHWSYW